MQPGERFRWVLPARPAGGFFGLSIYTTALGGIVLLPLGVSQMGPGSPSLGHQGPRWQGEK